MRYLFMLFTLALIGCGNDLPVVDCASGAVPLYSEVTAFNTCTACHSSALSGAARNDAPNDINYDTAAVAKVDAESAVSQVFGGSMPPAGYSVTEEQKQMLYKWGLCGTPE